MFKESPQIEYPADSRQILWRYMPSEHLKELLQTEKLYFRNLHCLPDGLEGRLTKRSREHCAKWFHINHRYTWEKAYDAVIKYENAQKDFYVNCWHMNMHESYLMWKVYSQKNGYAIRTTYERIKLAPCEITGGKVKYVDFENEGTSIGNLFDHVATKDKPYEDEREFRLVYWDLKTNTDIVKDSESALIPVNLGMLIKSIVVGPNVSAADSEVDRLIEEKNITIEYSNISERRT